MDSPSLRSARWKSRLPIPTFFTPARASRTSVPRSAPAMASTSPPTADRAGRISGCAIRGRSAASSSIRAIPTSSTLARWVTPTRPTPSAASSSRSTAALPGHTCWIKARTSASPISPSPLRIRTFFSRAPGTRIVRRGAPIRQSMAGRRHLSLHRQRRDAGRN